MSGDHGATLCGMTAEQFMGICEETSHRYAKEALATSALQRPLTRTEQSVLELGVVTAVKATYEELARRGLIVARP